MSPSTTWHKQAKRLEIFNGEFGFLPIAPKSKKPLIEWKSHAGLTIDECLTYPDCSAIAVLTGIHLLCLDFDSEKAVDYLAARDINFTQTSWHVIRNDGSLRFKSLYQPSPAQIEKLPVGEFQQINIDGIGLDLFLSAKRFVIVIGQHPKGGEYVWREGCGPEQLVAPDEKLWNLVVEKSPSFFSILAISRFAAL